MIKQLVINNKKSFDDFGVYIATRKITSPKKKVIKESVPFSNNIYDFSKINGELYWEERTLEYSFDIAEIKTEDMEVVKSKLLNWLLNVHDTDIYDPYIPNHHFHGSYNSDSWEEDFGAGTINVSFTVYPYKISNKPITHSRSLNAGVNELTIINNSSHRVTPTIICSENMSIQIGTIIYSFSAGETKVDSIKFESGKNELLVTPTTERANITISYIEEVF